ncbi:hypothetical protein VP1G_00490 [Cytospora mali]|uniref:Clr5 domain-containing protein n=1 Tax=Cytospora mali TaxID=578113 RepID=A0A194UNC0_CYTMA|nr:hypothetical protein VP1G_00490 [Valsa mali var. pyri (nom. inval.)]
MTKEWTKYKDTILSLYKDQSKTLDEVRRIMRENYGFEASRRSATATMAANYEPATRAGDVNTVDSFQRSGVQSQMPWSRHFSAPDLPVVEDDASLYLQHAVHSQIKSEAHTDNMSPVSTTFGHDQVEQSYCSLTVQEGQNLKALVHQFPRQEDGIGVAQEHSMLGSHFPHNSPSNASSLTDLDYIILQLQIPFQLDQLEMLLQCLRKEPDSHVPLSPGYSPFPYVANLFFKHLLPRNHNAGNKGNYELLGVLCQCFQYFISQGADPNILVGGTPLLFRLLDDPVATGAYGPFWECVRCLALKVPPIINQQDRHGGNMHNAPNALHVLLERAPDGETSVPPTPIETQNRIQLTTMLISRLAGLGRLNDRNAQGLSALHLYARRFAARDGHHFFRVCAEFVRHGADADADGVVPAGFAGEVRTAYRTGSLSPGLQQQSGVGVGVGVGGGATAITPWATIWISACRLSLCGDEAAVEEHLSFLQYGAAGGQADTGAYYLRTLLPRPVPQSAVLASPATSRSDGSEERNYTW